MRLSSAARYFDNMPCTDAYSGGETFYGQLDLYDDSKRDGTTVVRRVLSVDAAVTMPARRAVTIHDETYVVGGIHKDSFRGEVIRQKYIVHRCDGLANVTTFDQAIRGLTGTEMYAGRLWVKDLKELEASSHLTSFMNIYAAPTETIAVGSVVSLGDRLHLVRNAFVSAAGFLVAEADQLTDDCVAAVTYTSKSAGVYDPANDTVAGTSSAVTGIWHRWQDDYVYERMSQKEFLRGDIVMHVSKTSVATAVPGDRLTFDGTSWLVLSARDDGAGAWALHCRRD